MTCCRVLRAGFWVLMCSKLERRVAIERRKRWCFAGRWSWARAMTGFSVAQASLSMLMLSAVMSKISALASKGR